MGDCYITAVSFSREREMRKHTPTYLRFTTTTRGDVALVDVEMSSPASE